ncbi:hypothetical protein FGO68_gene6340 [Halteria grandinella]|uniref:Uncharacterized protein n=1 Tax=Halteria grandinella TaxID=5974 RepID=A0A8J8NCA3_HALGN|nr:hypothetical protein FGO68_gene6340 [Halteria grandinella]
MKFQATSKSSCFIYLASAILCPFYIMKGTPEANWNIASKISAKAAFQFTLDCDASYLLQSTQNEVLSLQ